MIYLDAAATTAVRREVLEAMWPFLAKEFGNASSHHSLGNAAARALRDARERIAAVLECRPGEVIFTSGGTEADNLAVKGISLEGLRGRHIVTTAIEHEAVLASCHYLQRFHDFEITYAPVDAGGRVDADSFARLLRRGTTLCSVMLGNNEVGTIQPIADLAKLAREQGIPFHTDAVQAAGLLDVRPDVLGVDALSLSGHKIGAPKGVGMLYLRSRTRVEPLMHGGGQEKERRSGTENVAGAVALATALELASSERVQRAQRLTLQRDALIAGVLREVPTAQLTGHAEERLAHHASFCFPGTSGESVLLALEERGILCSSGSACAAGSDEPSHVLTAMGFSRELAHTAVRFTLHDATTVEQVTETVRAVRDAVAAVSSLAR